VTPRAMRTREAHHDQHHRDTLEQTAMEWLENLGYEIAYGPDIAFDGQK